MRKTILSLTVALCLSALVFNGCSSPEKKEDAAEQKVEDAKQNLETVQVVNEEEWKTFKAEAKIKIAENDVRIAELKAKKAKPGTAMDDTYQKRIDNLEAQNKALTVKIDTYERNHTDWAEFKREFNHDMDGLGKAIDDLGTDNKK